jgi:hypothetical protein
VTIVTNADQSADFGGRLKATEHPATTLSNCRLSEVHDGASDASADLVSVTFNGTRAGIQVGRAHLLEPLSDPPPSDFARGGLSTSPAVTPRNSTLSASQRAQGNHNTK